MLFRQIIGRGYELKRSILLQEPVNPQESMEGLIRLPDAFIQGVNAEILREILEVSDERLESFKQAIEKVYHEDV